MGKGTKRKTVWRTFSFENGIGDKTVTSSAEQNENGQENKQTLNGTNGKYVSNWRYRRYATNGNENQSSENESPDDDKKTNENDHKDEGDQQKTIASNENNNNNNNNNNSNTNNNNINNGYRHHYHYHHHHNRPYYYKRWPLSDQQYVRNGFRKYSNENGTLSTTTTTATTTSSTSVTGTATSAENGTQVENGDNENSNHYVRSSNWASFHSNRHYNGSGSGGGSDSGGGGGGGGVGNGYRRWENRHYHSNNYNNRGFRKSYYSHSDKHQHQNYTAFTRHNEHHFNRNGSTDDGTCNGHEQRNSDDPSIEYQNGKHDSIKINEDEYTRISTPRSEVLFKKGYLMRSKKDTISHHHSAAAAAAAATPVQNANDSSSPSNGHTINQVPTSSNDSGSVSVVSNEETASYYSIQSMSPENQHYSNGNSCNLEGNPLQYASDPYSAEVPLIFSSGFYDNNGYFYVNPYVPSHFDQFNRPIGLMPFDNTTPTNGPYSAYTSPSPPAMTIETKSVDGDHHHNDFNKQHSINSEDISTSSFSENASINNDPVSPQSPLTPPPSPLSQPSSSDPASSNELNNNQKITEENNNNNNDNEIDAKTASATANETASDVGNSTEETSTIEPNQPNNGEESSKSTENLPNESNEVNDVELTDETVIPENYSVPYYSPFIFVPPIPFVPGGHMPYPRRNRFYRRYSYHHYNRFRKYNRFSHYNDKFYVPTNWSEAPDDSTAVVVQDGNAINNNDVESTTNIEKNSNDIIATPTLEQCDIILKNSKLNSNVSEFVPQNKRITVVPIPMAATPVFILPSQLNVNVPEFLPKNYQKIEEQSMPNSIENGSESLSTSINESQSNSESETMEQSTSIDEKNSQNDNVQVEKSSIENCANDDAPIDDNDDKSTSKSIELTKSSNVRTLSDILKTNTNINTNTNSNSFERTDISNSNNSSSTKIKNNYNNSNSNSNSKQQNSHINLKADLGNKNRNKIWYNRHNNNNNMNMNNDNNNNADNKNNNNINNTNNDLNMISKTSNNNNNDKNIDKRNTIKQMTKSAYPAMKLDHKGQKTRSNGGGGGGGELTKTPEPNNQISSHNSNKLLNRVPSKDVSLSSKKSNSAAVSSSSSYAQMVVPTAKSTESITVSTEMTVKMKSANNSISPQNQSKKLKNQSRKSVQQTKEKQMINDQNKSAQDSNGPIEWFTVGAKGKKQAISNDKPNFIDFTENLIHEDNSKEEKVSKVAEELQLDIKKDSDLAMDIMDSLNIPEPAKSSTKNQIVNNQMQTKKKSTAEKNSKKKSTKDKIFKETKRSRSETFEIIEPNFGNETKSTTINDNNIIINQNESQKSNESKTKMEKIDDDEFTFDPNVFTTPLNLKVAADLVVPEKCSNAPPCTVLRLSANKSIRSLMNSSFDIYQSDFNPSASVETQQLQEEEEMVNKVLQSLKKTEIVENIETVHDDEHERETNETDASTIIEQSINNSVDDDYDDNKVDGSIDTDDGGHSSHSSASPIHFDVNAKPYQNVYSSNHFLGHFFGDKDDKCDQQVVHSATLSSSNQITPNAEEEEEEEEEVELNESICVNNSTELESKVQNDKNSISTDGSDNEHAPDAFDDDEQKNVSDIDDTAQHTDGEDSGVEFQSENNTIRSDSKSIDCIINEHMNSTFNDSPMNDEPNDEQITLSIDSNEIKSSESESLNDDVDNKVPKIELTKNNNKKNPQIPIITTEQQPWLRIVDTQMLEQQKKLQNTFPITTAVSMWLNKAQKEKTPEPILRLPNGWFGARRTKTTSQTSQCSANSIGTDHGDHYSSDETASLTSDKDKLDITSIVDDDDEEDILNYWELENVTAAAAAAKNATESSTATNINMIEQNGTHKINQQTQPIYNSVYGNSINYEKLLSNENELLCNNIICDFEHDAMIAAATDVAITKANNTNTNANANNDKLQMSSNEQKLGPTDTDTYYKPAPEVCCTIM